MYDVFLFLSLYEHVYIFFFDSHNISDTRFPFMCRKVDIFMVIASSVYLWKTTGRGKKKQVLTIIILKRGGRSEDVSKGVVALFIFHAPIQRLDYVEQPH